MPPDRRLTDAEIRRKTNKPIMEKRRRERINKCLEDLKSIVLTAISENSRPNKLEKADILEMTVQYLKSIHSGKPITPEILNLLGSSNSKPKASTSATETKIVQKGYAQCVREVTSFLSQTEGVPVEFRTQLLGHLANQCNPVPDGKTDKKQPKALHPSLQQKSAVNKTFMSELDLRRQSKVRGQMPTPVKIPTQNPSDRFQSSTNISYLQNATTIHEMHCGQRLSPGPVSPISDSSTSSSNVIVRQNPSPCLSSASNRSDDSTGATSFIDSLHFSNFADSVCHSPNHNRNLAVHRFAEQHNLNYISSDSGNWSSGSNPPSPMAPLNQPRKAQSANNQVFKSSAPLQSGMWRPWSI
ncbi:uncharacterized protein LOC143449347 [Clavelina lepadiformis]|uniref:uncharacterized protein LOC143449347 n=1 Tax=Clavelina lepadiformis TaxID=159417 RepID=UPI004042CFF9